MSNKNNFVTIKELYEWAVAQGQENTPLGITISGNCSDCSEELNFMSAVYITKDNTEIGSYWEDNKLAVKPFVWINLHKDSEMEV